jgi:probable F420-dependent oxidoreductase
MRIGVTLPHYGVFANRESVTAIADAAERLGFDSVWTTDHVIMPDTLPEPYGDILETMATLTWIAARTERIALGTSVVVLPQREPVLLAKQAATIHHLSRGRLTVGVGVGWAEGEFAFLGADFAARGRRLDEYMGVLRALWGSRTPSFHGETVDIEHALFSPVDDELPPIPIVVGGSSRAALRRIAELGDGWHANNVTPAEFTAGVAAIAAASDRPMHHSLRMTTVLGDSADPHAAERHLTGSPARMAERLGEWRELGVEEVVLDLRPASTREYLDAIETIAGEVLPALR